MRILALEVIFALLPASIVVDLWTSLWVVEVAVGRSAEVLLAMRVIAFTPLVFLVDAGAKRSLVAVEHELLQRHLSVQLVQIKGKSSVLHQVPHHLAFLCGVGKRVVFLLLLIQGVYYVHQVTRRKVVQSVRRLCVTEDDD